MINETQDYGLRFFVIAFAMTMEEKQKLFKKNILRILQATLQMIKTNGTSLEGFSHTVGAKGNSLV